MFFNCDLLLDKAPDYTAGCVLSGDPVYFQLHISSSVCTVEPACGDFHFQEKTVTQPSTLDLELMFSFPVVLGVRGRGVETEMSMRLAG